MSTFSSELYQREMNKTNNKNTIKRESKTNKKGRLAESSESRCPQKFSRHYFTIGAQVQVIIPIIKLRHWILFYGASILRKTREKMKNDEEKTASKTPSRTVNSSRTKKDSGNNNLCFKNVQKFVKQWVLQSESPNIMSEGMWCK
jgi:hypothetical protein